MSERVSSVKNLKFSQHKIKETYSRLKEAKIGQLFFASCKFQVRFKVNKFSQKNFFLAAAVKKKEFFIFIVLVEESRRERERASEGEWTYKIHQHSDNMAYMNQFSFSKVVNYREEKIYCAIEFMH